MKTNETTPMPQGYKMTSLGVIPQDWEEKKLGDIAEINPRNGEITSQFVTFLTMSDISEHGGIIKENIIPNISLKPGFTSFKKGDIIIAKITPCFENGKGALLDNITEEYGFGSTEFHVIRSRQCNHFIYFHTISYAFRKRLESQMTGSAGQKRVPADSVSSYKLPVPPLPEQQKIAEVLGTWDKAIEKQSQLIKKLELRKKGLMQQLLTGKKRLPGFSGEWRRVKMGEIASLYQPQTIQSEDLLSTGFPVYGANGLIGYYKKFNHELPQVVITCRGSSCGTVNYTPEKCWITGNAMVLNVDNNQNINKTFFYYLISNSSFAHLISGSGQPQIVRQPLLKFELLIPTFKEQTAIAQVLTTADREIELAQQKFELLRQQKRGLMQQLLTGKKRVKY